MRLQPPTYLEVTGAILLQLPWAIRHWTLYNHSLFWATSLYISSVVALIIISMAIIRFIAKLHNKLWTKWHKKKLTAPPDWIEEHFSHLDLDHDETFKTTSFWISSRKYTINWLLTYEQFFNSTVLQIEMQQNDIKSLFKDKLRDGKLDDLLNGDK